jgi:hypothetical protein
MTDEQIFTTDPMAEFNALQAVIAALQPLPTEARQRIVDSTVTFLKLTPARSPSAPERGVTHSISNREVAPAFSTDRTMSPKEFLNEKQPRTDVERMACLAYYLTHYRDTPHFKTLDLSKLNTDAAQPKFANAANTTNNAVKQGYLVPSNKGLRQISAAGERFVLALPDRESAKTVMTSLRPRRRSSRARSSGDNQE